MGVLGRGEVSVYRGFCSSITHHRRYGCLRGIWKRGDRFLQPVTSPLLLFVLNRVLTFGSFRLEQVCYALRCSGRHACYND